MAAVTPSRSVSRATSLEVGSALLAPSTHGPAGPAGTTHLVEGWTPVCGGARVRFVFPGRLGSTGATCPDCAQVATGSADAGGAGGTGGGGGAGRAAVGAVPRQRSAARATAGRSRSKAS